MMVIVVCVAAVIGIVAFCKVNKKKKLLNKQTMQAEDKLREAYLDKAILNPQACLSNLEIDAVSPYSVSYDAATIEHISRKKDLSGKSNTKLMLQITENGELSARKYMLDPEEGINIGSSSTDNHIVIFDKTAGDVQCKIVSRDHKVYIRNSFSDEKITLVRKNERALIKDKSFELANNDAIIFGNTLLRVEFIYIRIS